MKDATVSKIIVSNCLKFVFVFSVYYFFKKKKVLWKEASKNFFTIIFIKCSNKDEFVRLLICTILGKVMSLILRGCGKLYFRLLLFFLRVRELSNNEFRRSDILRQKNIKSLGFREKTYRNLWGKVSNVQIPTRTARPMPPKVTVGKSFLRGSTKLTFPLPRPSLALLATNLFLDAIFCPFFCKFFMKGNVIKRLETTHRAP